MTYTGITDLILKILKVKHFIRNLNLLFLLQFLDLKAEKCIFKYFPASEFMDITIMTC